MNSGASEPAPPGNRPARPTPASQGAHHAVDLNLGRVITAPLAGPPTPESRAEALARLGPPIDSALFGGPLYRLSVRTPYQASPEAWLSGVGIDQFVPWSDHIAPDGHKYGLIEFVPPQGWVPQPGSLRALYFYFSQLPPFNTVLLSIPLVGVSWPGATGHVSLGYTELGHEQGPVSGQVRVALSNNGGVQWLDVLYAPQTEVLPQFVLNIEAGVEQVLFSYATLGFPPPVIYPGPAQPG